MRRLLLIGLLLGGLQTLPGCDTAADNTAVTPEKTAPLPSVKPKADPGQGLGSPPPAAN